MSSELDKIINDGRVNPSTAMVIFAVELKNQGETLKSLKDTINEDNKRYVPVKDYEALEKRVSRLENGALKVLTVISGIVMLAVIGLVITKS